jgi:c(7)-type cytochrome triheme protein
MKKTFFLLSFLFIAFFFVRDSIAASTGEYGDVILNKNASAMREIGVKDVLFPHTFHRIRFKCKVCHNDIFIMKAGANEINMNVIMEGEKCGKCHNGIIAWEPIECDRCHSMTPGYTGGVVQNAKRK